MEVFRQGGGYVKRVLTKTFKLSNNKQTQILMEGVTVCYSISPVETILKRIYRINLKGLLRDFKVCACVFSHHCAGRDLDPSAGSCQRGPEGLGS